LITTQWVSDIASPILNISNLSFPKYKTPDTLYHYLQTHYPQVEEQLLQAISIQSDHTYVSIEDIVWESQRSCLQNMTLCRQHRFFPLFEGPSQVGILVDNPFNPIIDTPELANLPAKSIIPFTTTSSQLNQWFHQIHQSNQPYSILDQIMIDAHHSHATDIHFSETLTHIHIQSRIDGLMNPMQSLIKTDAPYLMNQIKVLSHMDLGVTPYPQDGHYHWKAGTTSIECRVSSIPTQFGEDIVFRLMTPDTAIKPLNKLGLSDDLYQAFSQTLLQPNGLILITGPTGSGKTTTLYAALEILRQKKDKTIITLEDPIERNIPGVRQSQINSKSNYTFSSGLKALLRQDPDIIMVGEIRDKETAQMALDAAYTGHLVLSTLHTNSIEMTLHRLASFDIDPFLIGHALRCIVTQNLVPKSCPHCNHSGCSECRFQGVLGRQLQAECLTIPEPIAISDYTEGTRLLFEKGQLTKSKWSNNDPAP
jgi:type II secretory ATPase GspE/PulE/Tfp pilus assembly ATPase PilB-like protein